MVVWMWGWEGGGGVGDIDEDREEDWGRGDLRILCQVLRGRNHVTLGMRCPVRFRSVTLITFS